jgi:hypothetical protein
LEPGGLLVARVYTQVEPKEIPENVIASFKSGLITKYYEFSFRIWSAWQTDVSNGVVQNRRFMNQKLHELGISLQEVYDKTGHDPPVLSVQGKDQTGPQLKITFPTKDQFVDVLSKYLRVVDVQCGNYSLGNRCPIFALESIS